MKTALMAAASALPLETRSLALETREDAPELAAMTRAVDELRSAVEAGDKKRTDELKALQDRLDELELKSKRPKGDPNPDDQDEQTKLQTRAFNTYLRYGREGLSAEEVRAMTVGNDVAGGYLAPGEMSSEIIKNVTEITPIRQLSTIRPTGAGEITLNRRTGRPTGGWVGENEESGESEGTYGQLSIPVNGLRVYTDVSNQLIEDAQADIEAEVVEGLSESFAELEGRAHIVGDGVKKPLGIIDSNSELSYTPTGHASAFASSNPADALITLFYAVKSVYRNNATWMMNSNTVAAIRKFKDSTGQYLWQPPIAAGQPATLLGRPIAEAVDMPDLGANNFPIAFGDFAKGHRIYDRAQMTVLRDPFTLAKSNKTRFYAGRRVGGRVVLAEAIRLLKCATS